jgi:hypothetical protein
MANTVCKLLGSVFLDQAHLVVLDDLMCKVLADVDVLLTLSPADHKVSPGPLDAIRVILVHGCVRNLWKSHISESEPVSEIQDLDAHLRHCVVLCLSSRKRDCHSTMPLLYLGISPVVGVLEMLLPQSESAYPAKPPLPPLW